MLGGCFLTFLFSIGKIVPIASLLGGYDITSKANGTILIELHSMNKTNSLHLKKLALGETILFFVIRPIFKGESCWLCGGYLDPSSFEAPRNCSNDTKGTRRSRNGAFPAAGLGVMPIGTTFFITIFLDWEMINLHFPTQHPRMGNFQKPTNTL